MPPAQRCTSRPAAHLTEHCRENLLSWASANDSEKLSDQKELPGDNASLWCELQRRRLDAGWQETAWKSQQKGTCTSPVQPTLAHRGISTPLKFSFGSHHCVCVVRNEKSLGEAGRSLRKQTWI